MAFIEVKRRCQECGKTREALRELRAEVDSIRLDYHALYEKVRVNLAKLAARAKQAEEEPEKQNGPQNAEDPLLHARTLLLERKLKRG